MQHTRVAAFVTVVLSSAAACSFDPNGAEGGGAVDAAINDAYVLDEGVPPPPPADARVDAPPAPDAAIDGGIVVGPPDAALPDATPLPPDATPLPPDASMPQTCPSGYQHGQHQNSDHCYRFYQTGKSWPSAESDCENDNSGGGPKPHLIVFSNEAEYADVQSAIAAIPLIGTGEIWIGASDIASEGNFVNVTGGPFISTHFQTGEPNDFGDGPMGMAEDCLNFRVTSPVGINDLSCTGTHPYLCEIDGDSP